MNKKSFLTLFIAVLISLTACNKEPKATSIEVASGNNQTGEVGTVLATPIVITVKDQKGEAYPDATVKFEVSEGSVSSATATTDDNGNVSVTWTLGSTEGEQTLTITAFEEDETTPLENSPITIKATANVIIKGEFSYQNTNYDLANGYLYKVDPHDFVLVISSPDIIAGEDGPQGNGQTIQFVIYLPNDDISAPYFRMGETANEEANLFYGWFRYGEFGEHENYETLVFGDGTLTINKTDDIYEITFNITFENGSDLTGNYTGSLVYLEEEKK